MRREFCRSSSAVNGPRFTVGLVGCTPIDRESHGGDDGRLETEWAKSREGGGGRQSERGAQRRAKSIEESTLDEGRRMRRERARGGAGARTHLRQQLLLRESLTPPR